MNSFRTFNRFATFAGPAMRLFAVLAVFAAMLAGPCSAVAALSAEHDGKPAAAAHAGSNGEHAGEAEHGLPPSAPKIFNIGPLEVSSSMIVTWIVTIGIILFARFATAKMR